MFDQVVKGVHVKESENPPQLVDMTLSKKLFFSERFTKDFRLREKVFERLMAASKHLPDGYYFIVYEGFRPRSKQLELWADHMAELRTQHPDWNDDECINETSKFVANPHNFGSGHQAGAAIDISLCDKKGRPYDLGTKIDAFGDKARTDSLEISDEAKKHRNILRSTLEHEGFVNYPEEWWHYSYGDLLWALLLGKSEAFFAPID